MKFEKLFELIESSFTSAKREIIIISPYIKSDALLKCLKNINQDEIGLSVFVRWEKRDFLFGASDLEVFDLVSEFGGRLYRNPNLHAKLYISDDKLLLGSANLTNRGLGLNVNISNLEILTELAVDAPVTEFFMEELKQKSHIVSELFIKEMKEELEKAKEHDDYVSDFNYKNYVSYNSNSLISLEDLPPESLISDEEKLRKFLEFESGDFVNTISESLAIKLLKRNMKVGESLNFGAVSKIIHDNLVKDPRPYRSEIKKRQNFLYELILKYLRDDFKLYIQDNGYSQIIERLK